MTVKNHKQNTHFQIAYFLAGSCHTPDGAYALLQNLREERQAALNNFNVSQLRTKAKKTAAEKALKKNKDDFEAQADLLEIEQGTEMGKILYDAAMEELKFIEECIRRVNPHRKFKHLPDPEAHEAAQRDEWKLELIGRAENYLLTTGSIPPDHFGTMRMHPDFKTEILPAVDNIMAALQDPNKHRKFLLEATVGLTAILLEE